MKIVKKFKRGGRQIWRSLLSFLLVFALFIGLMPTVAFALELQITSVDQLNNIGTAELDETEYKVYHFKVDPTKYDVVRIYKCYIQTDLPVVGSKIKSVGVLEKNADEYNKGKTFYEQNISQNITQEIQDQLEDDVEKLGYYLYRTKRGKVSEIFGILILEWPEGSIIRADKTELVDCIATTNDVHSESYYQTEDRYNGKNSSEDGFWADFQTTLTQANAVNDNVDATQEEVDATTKRLKTAMEALIPVTQANTTVLYEALEKYQDTSRYSADAFSKNSWGGFESVRYEAQTFLNSLFDAQGSATESNIAENQTQIEAQVKALIDASKELDRRANAYQKPDSENALEGIRLYAQWYDPEKLRESDYTDESWNAFVEARTCALNVLDTNGHYYAAMGASELKEQTDAFRNFRAACHGLVENKSSITATVSVVDNYVLRKNTKLTALSNTQTLTLVPGTTIGDVLTQLKFTEDEINWHTDQAVYLNGMLYYDVSPCALNGISYDDSKYKSVKLQDGDVLVIARMDLPLYSNISGLSMRVETGTVLEHIRYQTMIPEKTTVKAGESFGVTVHTKMAMPTEYTGESLPMRGASIYVGDADPDKEQACQKPIINNTLVVTDENGKAQITLYDEGWCLLNAYDLNDEYATLCNGASVLIYVEPADDVTAVKEQMKAELKGALENPHYAESYFTVEDWTAMQTAYANGVANIDSVQSISEARAVQLDGLAVILEKQKKADQYNAQNLEIFRELLSGLPNDLSKLDASVTSQVNNLHTRYDKMTQYQLQQLTQKEINTYEAIMAIDADGLPPAKAYQLKVEYDFTGVPEADCEKLQDMLEYLIANTKHEGKRDVLGGEKLADLYSFNTTSNSSSMGGTVFAPITEAYGGTRVSFCMSPEYASYMQIRKDRNYTVDGQPYGNTDHCDKLTGNGWSIQDTSTAAVTDMSFGLKPSRTYTVNGNTYEMRGISVEGLEKNAYKTLGYGFFDFSDYLGKSISNQTFVKLDDTFIKFPMPYGDVTVTVQWVPTGGTNQEITEAKETAQTAITVRYGKYASKDYTEQNWATLTKAKEDGLTAIANAQTLDEIAQARKAALAAMAAVSSTTSGSTTIPGGDENLPDLGKSVGKVYIQLENNTFSGGDFTGTILSGWYNLCAQDTMMTSVLKALKMEGYSWTGTGATDGDTHGYTITYLASISKDGKKLGEFDGDAGSGWMGTLNDWFTNEGFNNFGVSNDKLENGDIINIAYTQNLGVDLGGTWGNSDTSLSALQITGGTLVPVFDGETLKYSLMIPDDKANITVVPTAANKNYLVKTFLNAYNSDSGFYKRTEMIPVKSGDTIYVGVGEQEWPSMNNQGDEARAYTGTKYTIHVYSGGKDGVQIQINALPEAGKITLSNYQKYQDTVVAIRKAYDALSDKSGITITKLIAAEKKVTFFAAIDNVKSLLKAIPQANKLNTSDQSKVRAASDAYSKLTDEQKLYITLSDVAKYNAAVKWLETQGIHTGGTITGSESAPSSSIIEQHATVNGTKATVTISEQSITSAIKALKGSGRKAITIIPTDIGNATSSEIHISKASAKAIVKDTTASVLLQTGSGNVTIPNDTLGQITSAAGGSDVVVTVEKKTREDVSDLQIDTKNVAIAEVTVTSGGKAITSFGGNTMTISIPVNRNFTEGASYQVIVISADGSKEITVGKCVNTEGKSYVEVETKHLSTFIVTDIKSMNFTDVEANAWYYDAVKYVYDNGLLNGTSDTTFSPKGEMTRAMLVTALYRMDGSPAVTASNDFTDVNAGQYYTDAVIWASANGIVGGYGNALFGTNDSITREQLVAMLRRYAVYKKYDMPAGEDTNIQSYTDAQNIHDYAVTAMKWAVHTGLISGTTETTLMPNGTATRQQVATMLMRFCENVGK